MREIFLKKINFQNAITQSIRVLRAGGLVIAPSDTVYGLLADATNKKAVKKLIKFKDRPPGKPISVFVSDLEMLAVLVKVDSQQLYRLRQLLPGPFTVILESRHKVISGLKSEKGTLGIRIPDNNFIVDLVRRYNKPLTATSANLASRPPHYSIETLLSELSENNKKLINLVINDGKLPRNKTSTVVDLTEPNLKILRQGDLILTDEKTFISKSPDQTKKIAKFILKKLLSHVLSKPLIFIIEGELGVGKTIFVKGIGEFLSVTNIISPSFVIYYEYNTNCLSVKKLIHIDLYNIQEEEEFKYLGIENYLKKGNLLCFEWGEKVGTIFDFLKQKGQIIYIKMRYLNKNEREIFYVNTIN